MFRALRTIFLVLVTIGAFAAVFGVIAAVGVVRLATTNPAAPNVAADGAGTTQPAGVDGMAGGAAHPAGQSIVPVTTASEVNRAGTVAVKNANADVPSRIILNATDARLRGSMIRRDGDTHDVIGWSRADDWLDWPIEAPPGAFHVYQVDLTFACAPEMGGGFTLGIADQALAGHSGSTGSWGDFKTTRVGTIQVPGGKNRLSLKPAPGVQNELMRLRRVELVPAGSVEWIAGAPAAPVGLPAAAAPVAPQPVDGSLAVVGFTLIDTGPNAGIGQLADGATLDLGVLPARHMSIRADVAGAPGSVMFGMDHNARLHLEHAAPYAINSDQNGRFIPWAPPVGEHTLTATPYLGHDGNGVAGKGLTVHFTVLAARRDRAPIVLKAEDATLHGDGIHVEQVEGGQNIGYWDKGDQTVEWPAPAETRGKFNVLLTYAADNNSGGGDFELKAGGQTLTGHADPTGGWQSYRVLTLGAITLGRDKAAVIIKPTRLDSGRSLMNLRRVELEPVE